MKEYNFKINGNDFSVSVDKFEKSGAEVTVNGAQYYVEFKDESRDLQTAAEAQVSPDPVAVAVTASAPRPQVTRPQAAAKPSAGGLNSPLPGAIIEVFAKVGSTVKAGQKLLVLEAMKMENVIEADRDGIITSVNVAKGDTVLEGDLLLTIE